MSCRLLDILAVISLAVFAIAIFAWGGAILFAINGKVPNTDNMIDMLPTDGLFISVVGILPIIWFAKIRWHWTENRSSDLRVKCGTVPPKRI
jgi:TRAP-type C4-dicarboxylate transport system permease small subunit